MAPDKSSNSPWETKLPEVGLTDSIVRPSTDILTLLKQSNCVRMRDIVANVVQKGSNNCRLFGT